MPVEEVSHEVSEEERVAVNLNRVKVVNSPDFDPDEVPDLDLQSAVYDHYGRPTPEGNSTTKNSREPVATVKQEGSAAKEIGESREEGDGGVITAAAKEAAKGVVKGTAKGAL